CGRPTGRRSWRRNGYARTIARRDREFPGFARRSANRWREGPRALSLTAVGEIGQRVDRALEDVGGRQRVDLLRALGAADVRFDHRPLDRLGRPALVPQQDGKVERREVAGEGAHRLGARAVASVHAERKPDDEALAMLALDDLPEAFDILREFRPSDRFRRPSEMPPCVAD